MYFYTTSLSLDVCLVTQCKQNVSQRWRCPNSSNFLRLINSNSDAVAMLYDGNLTSPTLFVTVLYLMLIILLITNYELDSLLNEQFIINERSIPSVQSMNGLFTQTSSIIPSGYIYLSDQVFNHGPHETGQAGFYRFTIAIFS